MNFASLAFLIVATVASTVVTAQEKRSVAAQPETKTQTYTWYDGGKPKQVWLDKSLVAEFGQRTESVSKPVAVINGARLWRQDDQAVPRAQSEGRVSPILRDEGSGRMRALPGNVIVQLDPSWSNEQITAWLSAHKLQETKRLSNNVIVVTAPPGLASLELANRLHESGTVVSAQPDWWKQTGKR